MRRGIRKKGLKCPNIDVEAKWKSVLEKAESRKHGLDRVLAIVTESAEEIVGSFGSTEIRSIRSAIPDCPRLNRVFDLLGVDYPDWPYETAEGEAGKGSKKRKQPEASEKASGGTSKRGRRGRGRSKGHRPRGRLLQRGLRRRLLLTLGSTMEYNALSFDFSKYKYSTIIYRCHEIYFDTFGQHGFHFAQIRMNGF